MTDSTRINELQEKMLQAMSIVNGKLLDTISYDTTITATISDNTDKADGKYILTDGSKTFTAYSTVTNYSNNTTVYVTIPNGNWENQKMIIGKKTSDAETPFVFTTPFDSFFALTSNIVEKDIKSGELLANDIQVDQANGDTTLEDCFTFVNLYDKDVESSEEIVGYSRLGIKADFCSWTKEAVSGQYGLVITLTGKKPALTEGTEAEIKPYPFLFYNDKMYGNTYNFESYYNQEIVVDLESQDIGQVTHIRIDFFQYADFYDVNDNLLPNTIDGWKKYITGQYYRYGDISHKHDQGYIELDSQGNGYYIGDGDKLTNNLFVKNIEVYFGEDLSDYTSDLIKIYTASPTSYKRSVEVGKDNDNLKNIKLRWVHIEDGTPIDMMSKTDLDYEIRWYQYRVGAAAADEYCGIYWDRIDEIYEIEKELKEKLADIEKDEILSSEEKDNQIASLIEYYTSLKKDCDNKTLSFTPDVNKQQEKIKAIALYKDVIYRSNELIFTNEETVPLDKEAYHIENALMIYADDGTNGNYLIYGQSNSLKDTDWGKKERTLSAYFDANNDGEININEEKIELDFQEKEIENGIIKKIYSNPLTWIFPEDNSMIKLINGNATTILPEEDETEADVYQNVVKNDFPIYTINNRLVSNYSNNTVFCSYELNGVTYTTEKEFTFGVSGTMGYEETLVIDIVGDNKAVLNGGGKDENEKPTNVSFQVQLQDAQQTLQDLSNVEVKWQWFYNNGDSNKLAISENDKKSIISFSEADFDINHLYILQASVGDLTTYFSVPICTSDCSYINGCTEVIYQTNGEPQYSKEEYVLYDSNRKQMENISWVTFSEETNEKALRYIGEIDKSNNRLKPLAIYVDDAPVYGIKAIQGGVLKWSQPVLVVQNRWPSTAINNWDGQSLVLDEANSNIMASAISAGKKETDNSFSGVMIGDWSGKNLDTHETITNQTGVYGFHKGAMSYALTEDGKAFFGKYGKGRIYIDGNTANLYSSSYKNQNSGMMIDLNSNPYIKMAEGDATIYLGIEDYPYLEFTGKQDSSLYLSLDEKKKPYLRMTGSNLTQKIELGVDTYPYLHLKSNKDKDTYPFAIGSKFYIDWDGYLTTEDGKFKGTVNADSGYLNDLDVTGKLSVAMNSDWSRTGPIYLYTNNKAQQMGYIGFILGTDGENNTKNIGIKSTNSYGIVFESATNARLTASKGIYLDSDKIEITGEAAKAKNQYGIYARFA